MKLLRKQLIIPTILTVLLLGGLFLHANSRDQKITNSQTSNNGSPFPVVSENAIKEEVKDGVYTNFTYGFRMKYPKEIFNKVDRPWDPITDKWFYIEGQRVPILKVGKLDSPSNTKYYFESYDKCINAKSGEILSQTAKSGTSIKLYNTDIVCVTHSTPDGFKDGEPSYGYGATIKSPTDELFYINLGEFDLDKLQALRDEFDTIVKSFEFIASSN